MCTVMNHLLENMATCLASYLNSWLSLHLDLLGDYGQREVLGPERRIREVTHFLTGWGSTRPSLKFKNSHVPKLQIQNEQKPNWNQNQVQMSLLKSLGALCQCPAATRFGSGNSRARETLWGRVPIGIPGEKQHFTNSINQCHNFN